MVGKSRGGGVDVLCSARGISRGGSAALIVLCYTIYMFSSTTHNQWYSGNNNKIGGTKVRKRIFDMESMKTPYRLCYLQSRPVMDFWDSALRQCMRSRLFWSKWVRAANHSCTG